MPSKRVKPTKKVKPRIDWRKVWRAMDQHYETAYEHGEVANFISEVSCRRISRLVNAQLAGVKGKKCRKK